MYHIVILYPDVNINTAGPMPIVCHAATDFRCGSFSICRLSEWRGRVINVFELNIFRLYPQVGRIKMPFYEAWALLRINVRQRSAVYGIFRGEPELPREKQVPP